MNAVLAALAMAACLCAGLAAFCAVRLRAVRVGRARRREAAYGREVARAGALQASTGPGELALSYAESLTRRLYAESVLPLSPSVRAGNASKSRAGSWFKENAKQSGCVGEVSAAGYCEARLRLAFAGALAGCLAGVLFSTELGVALGFVGALFAGTAPKRAVITARKRRAATAQRHLSEMLEVVSLGLRSGLTFDRSFALYGSHFDNEFARSCSKAYRSWALGLVTREDALRELADSYDCEQLSRVVDSVVRSLRFGSALTDVLEEAAVQSRAHYRTMLEEKVAKAPVKMMLPTGTLILPAMLLMVMGPILLELMGGFS